MKFIAHRGKDKHSFYENTKEALLWCLKQDYIDGVELDIRMTKDKKFIISHNSSILYLGIDFYGIRNETLKTLQSLNLGTFDKPHFLNSLEEFLEAVDSDKIILLDVKEERSNMEEVMKELSKVLEKYTHLFISVCSFRYDIYQLKTSFPVGLLVSDFINKNKEYRPFTFLSVSRGAYPDITSPKKKMIWTVNRKEELKNISDDMLVITDKAYILVSK